MLINGFKGNNYLFILHNFENFKQSELLKSSNRIQKKTQPRSEVDNIRPAVQIRPIKQKHLYRDVLD